MFIALDNKWKIDRTARIEIGKPYPSYDVALAGENSMKDYLADHTDLAGF